MKTSRRGKFNVDALCVIDDKFSFTQYFHHKSDLFYRIALMAKNVEVIYVNNFLKLFLEQIIDKRISKNERHKSKHTIR